MKKTIAFFGLSAIVLFAGCSQEEAFLEIPKLKSASSEMESVNLHLVKQELEDISAEEWESIHFSKADFDLFLSSLTQKNEEDTQEIKKIEVKSSSIRITLNNTDGESLDNMLSAPFLDAKVRQAFLQSAYYDGQQPTVQITDAAGTVLSDTDKPLELVMP